MGSSVIRITIFLYLLFVLCSCSKSRKADSDEIDADTSVASNADASVASSNDASLPEESSQDTDDYCDQYDCFPIVPTSQNKCYDSDSNVLDPCPGTVGDPQCSETAWCGQDAQYPNDERIFVISVLEGDSVVKDACTDRMWQKDYLEQKSWEEAVTYCEQLQYAGYNDWRLPTYHELLDTIDYGIIDPVTNILGKPATDFPDAPAAHFWTSTSYYSDGTPGMLVSTGGGTGEYYMGPSEEFHAVRCIRGAAIKGEGEERYVYSDNGQKIVLDRATSLIWQSEHVEDKTWQEALQHCEGLSYAGYDDWRLPNINELRSIVTVEVERPGDPMLFGPTSTFPNMVRDSFWSSTPFSSSSGIDSIWMVRFGDGWITISTGTGEEAVRCVRGAATNTKIRASLAPRKPRLC